MGRDKQYAIPKVLEDSITGGIWHRSSPDALRRLLGEDMPDLELFENIDAMRRVSDQLDSAGYVDDPEFCMVRKSVEVADDPRLMFEQALFIGGAITPGDDVFVVAKLSSDMTDPPILVFDWARTIPNRWVRRGRLSELIRDLSLEVSNLNRNSEDS